MGNSPGKYAGKLGMENFRRPLRKDARGVPETFKQFMRHDFYWGFWGKFTPTAFFGLTVYLVGKPFGGVEGLNKVRVSAQKSNRIE